MLSDLLVNKQRFILVIDDINREKIAQNLFQKLLLEQQENESSIKTITFNQLLNYESVLNSFLTECKRSGKEPKWNVILPPLSDLLIYMRPASVFESIHSLNKCLQIKRTYLWAASPYLIHPHTKYLLSALEYMANLVLRLETVDTLLYTARFSDGRLKYKRYAYKRTDFELKVDSTNGDESSSISADSESPHSNSSGSFVIELDEEELEASLQKLT